ncbi:UNVERIFIED_CONTAM: RHS repeat-associated protein [Acetivibrio alkalicellulosi]
MYTKRKFFAVVMLVVLITNMFLTSIGKVYAVEKTNLIEIEDTVELTSNGRINSDEDSITKFNQISEHQGEGKEKVKEEKVKEEKNKEEKNKEDKDKEDKDIKNKKENGIIVVYKDIKKSDNVKTQISINNNIAQIKSNKLSDKLNIEKLEISVEESLEAVLEDLNNHPNVLYAQPDYILETFDFQQLEHFENQWSLLNNGQIIGGQQGIVGIDVNIQGAWDITQGSEDVIVAVIDTGVDIFHSDISNSIFINSNEILNGEDTDNNGLIDDINGWDFANNNNTVYNSPEYDIHGTHISGIITASINNGGIAGVAPNVTILPVKFIDGNVGKTSDAIKAIEYAASMGASIFSCSWGSRHYNQALKDVIERTDGLFIFAAGNSAKDTTIEPIYPAAYGLDNIISVTAIDNNGELALFSNYGSNIDIAAPGVAVISTVPEEGYDYLSGTSIAVPHVTGVAALLKSIDNNLNSSEIKERILNNVTVSSKLSGKVSTSGMLNASATLLNEQPIDDENEQEDELIHEDEDKEPANLYDNSLEGNNKEYKPIINRFNFLDSFIESGELGALYSGNGIENLSIHNVKEDFFLVTWKTNVDAMSQVFFENEENLEKIAEGFSYAGRHQLMFKMEDMADAKNYMVKSVTEDGSVFQSEVRNISNDITYLGEVAPEYPYEYFDYEEVQEELNFSPLAYVMSNNNNTSYATAQHIGECTVFGTVQSGITGYYYSMNLNQNMWYSFMLTGMAQGEDYDLYIRDQYGTLLAFSTVNGNYDEFISYSSTYTGIHYIIVVPYTTSISSVHNNYQLLAYSNNNPPDMLEPNDCMGTATVITHDSPHYATIHVNTDDDWYVFNTNRTGKLHVSLTNIPTGCDYDLQVYKDGIYLGGSFAGSNNDENFIRLVENPGVYHIRVYSYSGSNPNSHYQIRVGVYTPDSYEINDNINDVRLYGVPLELNSTIYGTIDNRKDDDYYKLIIEESTEVEILLQNIPSGRDYDLILYQYSQWQYNSIAHSLRGGNQDEIITLQLEPGQYYIRVYSYNGYCEIQNYSLSITDLGTQGIVWVELDKATASVGEIITAQVKISDIPQFAGYELNLIYDKNLIRPVKDDLTPYTNRTMPSDRNVIINESFNPITFVNHDIERGYIGFGVTYSSLEAYRNAGIIETGDTLGIIKFEVLEENLIEIKVEDFKLPSSNGVKFFDVYGSEIMDSHIVEQPPTVNQHLLVYTPESMVDLGDSDLPLMLLTTNNYKIRGYIKPDFTYSPQSATTLQSGFIVSIDGTNLSATTNESGYFEIENIPSGVYNLTISKNQYLTRYIKNIPTAFYNEIYLGSEEQPIKMWGGDIVYDTAINMNDIMKAVIAFNSVSGQEGYDEDADINKDNAVNMEDIMIIIKNFNRSSNCYPDFKHEINFSQSNNEITFDRNIELEGDLIIKNGTVDLNGHTLVVRGSLIVSSEESNPYSYSTININGGSLFVGEDFKKNGYSRLIMRNSNDYVLVNGDFETRSAIDHENNEKDSQKGGDGEACLINGILEIRGDFLQIIDSESQHPGDPRNFATQDNHTVILSGKNIQKIRFDGVDIQGNDNQGYNYDESYFENLIITKPLEAGYELILKEWSVKAWKNLNYRFSPITSEPEEVDSLPFLRDGIGVATVYAKIYAFGGYDSDSDVYYKNINEYDPVQGQWLSTYEMQVRRKNPGVVEIDNEIFIIGGENSDGYVTSIERFSPVTGSFIISNVHMPRERAEFAVAASGNKIYIIGGYNDNGYVSETDIYDINSNQWTVINNNGHVFTHRKGLVAVEFDGYIYVIGGVNETGYLTAVEKLNTSNNSWESASNMSKARAYLGAEVISGKIYALGGFNGLDHLSNVEEYDPVKNEWMNPQKSNSHVIKITYNHGAQPEPRSSFGTAVVYNQIYLIGGKDKNGLHERPQKYVGHEMPGLSMYTGAIVRNTVGNRLLSGDYTTSITDLNINSPGVPINLIRTYNSSDSNEETFIGKGWRFNYDSYLEVKSQFGRVTASALNVREGPSIDHKSIGLAAKDSIFNIEYENGVAKEYNLNWYKIYLRGDEYYVHKTYIDTFESGVEIKTDAGISVVFEYDTDNNKYIASYGNYGKLFKISGVDEYIYATNDMLTYGYTKNQGDNLYRLNWIKDKYGNTTYINGEIVNGIYRINEVSEVAGASLTFDYTDNDYDVIVEDSESRKFKYKLVDGYLQEVINEFDKGTWYNYYSDSDNNGKLEEVKIQVEKEEDNEITIVYERILKNFYDSYGRVFKQEDAYKNVKYWLFLDVYADERAPDGEEALGSVKRKFIDQNNVATTIEYNSFLKLPIREEHADGGIITYQYELFHNDEWEDITESNASKKDIFNENKKRRHYTTDKYGYTTMREIDANGNLIVETDHYDASVTTIDEAPYTEYEYDYHGDINNRIINSLIRVQEIKARDITDSLTTYEYKADKVTLEKEIRHLAYLDENNKVQYSPYAITEFEYDDLHQINGLVKNIKDADEVATTYEYNIRGYLEKSIDESDNETIYEYDDIGRIVKKTSPLGFETVYQYEGLVERTILTNENEISILEVEQDGYGNIVREILPKQYTEEKLYRTEYKYNLRNELVEKIERLTTGDTYVTSYTYDRAGNLQTETKPNGNIYITEYDKMNRIKNLSFMANANSDVVLLEEYIYTMPKRDTNSELRNNVVEKRVYYEKANDGYTPTEYNSTIITKDYKENTETIKQSGNADVIKIYSKKGNLMKETMGDDRNTQYAYDSLGRITAKRTSLEKIGEDIYYTRSAYKYTKEGKLEVEKTGVEKVLQTEIPTTYIGKSYEYDINGRLEKVYIYHEDDEVISKTETFNYEYDDDGNLNYQMITINNKSSIIRYKNNHFGKPEYKYEFVYPEDVYEIPDSETGIFAIVTKYEYDENGNLERETVSARKVNSSDYSQITTYSEVVTEYKYDEYGKLLETKGKGDIIDEEDSSSQATQKDVITQIKYDFEGRPEQVIDAKGNITEYFYTYADTGLVEKQTKILNEDNGQIEITSAVYYDWSGRVIAEVSPEHYDDDPNKALNDFSRTIYEYENNKLKQKIYIGDLTEFNPEEVSQKQTSNITMVIHSYDYDEYGNLTKEWSAKGFQENYYTEYKYNLANMVKEVLDPEAADIGLEYTVKYEYDTFGRVETETRVKGNTIEKGHPEGIFYSKIAYEYDYLGNLTKTWVGKGATDNFNPKQTGSLIEENTYNTVSNLVSQIDGNGNTTNYKYNLLHQLKEVEYPIDNTMQENGDSNYKVTYAYDLMGNLKIEYDNYEKVTLYEYDNLGRLQDKTVKREDGTESITVGARYDANGNKRFEIDGEENEIEYKYDSLDRLIEIRKVVISDGQPIDHIESYTYDKNGNVLTTTNSVIRDEDAVESIFENIYDEINRLIEKKDAYQVSIEKIIYDESNRQIYSYDALNNRTDYEYDKNDRLAKTIDPLVEIDPEMENLYYERSTGITRYDLAGNVMIKEDGKNNQTKYVYDEFDRLEYVINAKDEEITFTYDVNGNMTSQTDGRGYTTTYDYNAANLLIMRSDHGGRTGIEGNYTYDLKKTVSYRYYPDGSLRESTDRNEETTTYEYDIHGRLKEETVGNIAISYTYDDNGNQLTIADDTGTTVRAYDELGRVTSKTVPNIGEITFDYDIIYNEGLGYLAEVSTDPKGKKTTKVYDRVGRLKLVKDGDIGSQNTTTYNYYEDGKRESIEYHDGSRQEYKYYGDGLLYKLTNKKSDGTIMDTYTYKYDAAGNQKEKEEYINGINKGKTFYDYDYLNRLETVTEPSGRFTEYTYDASGNRETETIVYNGITTINTYDNNEQNRVKKITTEVEGSITDTIVYTYDDNGNQCIVTENGIIKTTNTYDEKNRLIQTNVNGTTVVNTYNGEGLRVAKSVNGSSLTMYLYEYDKVVLEVVTKPGQPDKVNRNLYGTNLLMRQADGLTLYYMYNGHADVTALIDTNGVIRATYYYDAFGNIDDEKYFTASGSPTSIPINNSIMYAGYQYDRETELYYLNARMYDPKIARFLQEDTYRGDPRDPLSLNLYAYCANNPIRYYDPTGHYYVDGMHVSEYWKKHKVNWTSWSGKEYSRNYMLQQDNKSRLIETREQVRAEWLDSHKSIIDSGKVHKQVAPGVYKWVYPDNSLENLRYIKGYNHFDYTVNGETLKVHIFVTNPRTEKLTFGIGITSSKEFVAEANAGFFGSGSPAYGIFAVDGKWIKGNQESYDYQNYPTLMAKTILLGDGTTRQLVTATNYKGQTSKRDEITRLASQHDWIIAGSTLLIRDGKISETSGNKIGSEAPNPRTILGYRGDGSFVIVAVDGEKISEYQRTGLTIKESAELMEKLDVKYALNLDGGPSTQMYVGGELVSIPILDNGRIRQVGSVIRVLEK